MRRLQKTILQMEQTFNHIAAHGGWRAKECANLVPQARPLILMDSCFGPKSPHPKSPHPRTQAQPLSLFLTRPREVRDRLIQKEHKCSLTRSKLADDDLEDMRRPSATKIHRRVWKTRHSLLYDYNGDQALPCLQSRRERPGRKRADSMRKRGHNQQPKNQTIPKVFTAHLARQLRYALFSVD